MGTGVSITILTLHKKHSSLKTEYLFEYYPKKNESDISDDRKLMVQSETMRRASDQLGLIDYPCLGYGVDPDRDTHSMKSDLFQSLIGAVYLGCGEEKCKEIIIMTIIDYFSVYY